VFQGVRLEGAGLWSDDGDREEAALSGGQSVKGAETPTHSAVL